jgi:hypothetical protein
MGREGGGARGSTIPTLGMLRTGRSLVKQQPSGLSKLKRLFPRTQRVLTKLASSIGLTKPPSRRVSFCEETSVFEFERQLLGGGGVPDGDAVALGLGPRCAQPLPTLIARVSLIHRRATAREADPKSLHGARPPLWTQVRERLRGRAGPEGDQGRVRVLGLSRRRPEDTVSAKAALSDARTPGCQPRD